MIAALCGGVGGSKLALGLYRTLSPDELTVIVNTADDLEFCGLHVSPDLDTVTYTLAGVAQAEFGWGIEGDTFEALAILERLGVPGWFRVGDRDLATHVFRTDAMRGGMSLTEVSLHIARSLGIRAQILPMTDSPVATRLLASGEWLHFQDYFVRRRHTDRIDEIVYEGIEETAASLLVLDALRDADVIVIANSNPVLSIFPILTVPGIKDALSTSRAPRIAVSPIIGRDAVSGPAGDLMSLVDQPSSALGVASAYANVLDGIVIDAKDERLVPEIRRMGLAAHCTETIMRNDEDKQRLAEETVRFARNLR